MGKKLTKLENNLKSGSRRHKRQPYGIPLKRITETIAVMREIVNRRNNKKDPT